MRAGEGQEPRPRPSRSSSSSRLLLAVLTAATISLTAGLLVVDRKASLAASSAAARLDSQKNIIKVKMKTSTLNMNDFISKRQADEVSLDNLTVGLAAVQLLSSELVKLKRAGLGLEKKVEQLEEGARRAKAGQQAGLHLLILQANISLCSGNTSSLTLPVAGVYRVEVEAVLAGPSYPGEQVITVTVNNASLAAGAVVSTVDQSHAPCPAPRPGMCTQYRHLLLARLPSQAVLAATHNRRDAGSLARVNICARASRAALPSGAQSVILTH